MKKILVMFLFFISFDLYSQSMRVLEEKLLLFQEQKDYDSIEVYSNKILELARIRRYPLDFQFLYYKYSLAESLTQQGKFEKSIDVIDQIQVEFRDSLSLFKGLFFNVLLTQGTNYYWTNNVEGYKKIVNQSFALLDNQYIDWNIEFILNSANSLLEFSLINEAFDALTFLDRNYSMFYSKNEKLYLRIQSLYTLIHIKKGEYVDAIKICDNVLGNQKLNEKSRRAFEISRVTALVGLDEYKNALDLNTQVISRLEKVDVNQNIDTLGFSLIQQASILNHLGRLVEAQFFYDKAICIFKEQSSNPDKSALAFALAHYAGYLQEIGYYSKSLNTNIEALTIRKENVKKNIYQIINLYNSIAENYLALGSIDNAIDFSNKALEYCAIYYDSTFPIYYSTLSNLAVYESIKGNLIKALDLNLKVLKLKEKAIGINSADYALSLNNLSVLYGNQRNYEKSIEYCTQAAQIRRNLFGENHSQFALSLANLGFNYLKIGDYKTSKQCNLNSLNIYSNSGKKYTESYSICSDNLSLSYYALSQYDSAYFYALNNYKNNSYNFNLNKAGLGENMALKAKYRLENAMNFTLNFFIHCKSNNNELYANCLNSKGIVSNSSSLLTKRIYSDKVVGDIQLFEELKFLKTKLLNIYEDENTLNNDNSLEIQLKIEEIEKKLSLKYNYLKNNISNYELTKVLSDNNVFLDIFPFPKYDFVEDRWLDSNNYIVFISNSDDTLVDYVIIENGLELEQNIYTDYKIEVSEKRNASDLKNEIYYNSFWKPIADKIGDAKTVYVSLGGAYNNINLNTLYNPETGKYLIEEKDIRIVNSARDFVLMKGREKKEYTSNTSALYGFPDFNGNASMTADTMDYFALTRDLDQQWIDSLTRGGMKAAPLPSTKVEVDEIAGTFQKNGWNVKTYTGVAASEGNIKQEVSPRVLHIATHGYFFEDIQLDKTTDRFLGMDRQRVVQDPMLRSGLLMTGANKTLQGEEMKGENGLLSAAEASLMDLRGTELVVLSACETGKGEVKNSEGVYGLRKAFSDAGARNIIMSLWKVDDKVTQEFMTRFYEIWLNEKTSIREAFNRTQLEIKAKYPQPFYWGAFILVGE
jgi:CHAT domain-containing protein